MSLFLIAIVSLFFSGSTNGTSSDNSMTSKDVCARFGSVGIRHIKEDINLEGNTMVLPTNCILIFEGGSICNGNVVFSGTIIKSSKNTTPRFVNVDFSGTVSNYISPCWFVNDSWDDTRIIQRCIDVCNVVDLSENVYHTKQLNLHSSLTLRNGTLITNDDYGLYGVANNGIVLKNIIINGENRTSCGIFISDSRDIKIDNITIRGLFSEKDAAVGVYCRRCNNTTITSSSISNVVAIPNGIVGDAQGASRAIVIQHCFDVNIANSLFSEIVSNEDGDGIHIINEVDNKHGNIVIRDCTIKNCSRRLLKIHAPGVSIIGNQLLTDNEDYWLDYVVSVYSSNCRIESNTINAASSIPIQIGGASGKSLSDFEISKNAIRDVGNSNQGVITISSPIESLVISNNKFDIIDNHQCGIYVRNKCNKAIVTHNKQYGGRGLLFIRLSKSGVKVDDISVKYNTVETEGYFFAMMAFGEDDPIGKISIYDNVVKLDNLTYQQDAIFVTPISASLRNRISVKRNKSREPVAFNRRTRGSTTHRPTVLNEDNKGYIYYDETIGRTVKWDGTSWNDKH